MGSSPWHDETPVTGYTRCGSLSPDGSEFVRPPAHSHALMPMRWILATVLLMRLCPICDGAEPVANPFTPRTPAAIPKVVAPGGYARQTPANTARAVAMAIEDGLDAMELDVRRTKDGRHVIFDADQLDGKSSGTGPLREQTLADLQALDFGSWFAKRFAGAKIVTLGECLDMARGKAGLVLVGRDVEPEAFAREILAAEMADQVVVSATDDVLSRLRELSAGKIRTLRPLPADQDAKEWLAVGIAGKEPEVALVPAAKATTETCDTLHTKQVCVVSDARGPNDNPEGWDRLLAAHVDIVRTDRPEEFLAHAISLRTANRTVKYAAHRGALRYAPENTVASLDAAAKLHADFVEIDVHTTSDGGLFLLHDGTLDRTTNGRGRVRQATNEVMRGLDAGSWFGLPFAGAAVPELDGYLAKFPSSMGLYFDAKDITPEELAAAVAKHNLVERTVVYQGPVYLEKLKQINPAIRTLAPVAAASHVDTLAKRFKPYAVDTAWKLLSPEYIKHCHELDIKVFSDAKGDTTIEQYRQAIEWGIDLIQTDHPLRLWRAIDQL